MKKVRISCLNPPPIKIPDFRSVDWLRSRKGLIGPYSFRGGYLLSLDSAELVAGRGILARNENAQLYRLPSEERAFSFAPSIKYIVLSLIFLGLANCSHQPLYLTPPNEAPQDHGWYGVRLRIIPRSDRSADWAAGVYLTQCMVRPLLKEYDHDLPLWRIHRRAAADASGHQFSFLFYTTARHSKRVFAEARELMDQLKLREQGVIWAAGFGRVGRGNSVAATSDSAWTVALQNSWPSYAMGVSKLWLLLVNHETLNIAEEDPCSTKNPWRNLFEPIKKQLASLWYEEGEHALLHHLNAIFGYEEVKIESGDVVF